MRVRLLTVIALAITLSACFSAKPITTSPAVAPSPSTGVSPAIFPHKAEWKDPAQHGVYVKDVLGLDATTCLACHQETESVSGGAPTCRSCHKLFPHTDPGVTEKTHGDYVLKNGKSACATQCHGTDLQGGLSGVPCTKCHATYPHADAWSTPGVHGSKSEGDLKTKNECNLCHGSDWNGGDSKISCLNCHKGSYPHPDGWAAPEQHGAFTTKNGTGKCATQCHGVQLDGGLSGVSCKTCHTVWPHPTTGWMAQHGDKAQSIGLNGCVGCHKNDATGGKTGVNCTQCHTSLPSHQDANWDKSGHGKLVMQQPSVLTDPKGCPLCHGAKLEGGKAPTLPDLKKVPGCNDCHTSYPTLHTPAWKTYDGHAKWVLNQVDITKGNVLTQLTTLIGDCKVCHGTDLKGGNSGKSCYVSGCHTTFPHNADPAATPWLTKHGAIAAAETPNAASCATVNCHGAKLEGSSFNGKKLVAACNDCHLQMPHQATWLKTHGASATASDKFVACTKCHGDNLKGNGTSPSCYKCHDSFPLPHRNVDGTKNPQWTPAIGIDFHGVPVMAAAGATTKDKAQTLKCTTCHDSGNNGNPTPSCYACHASFPHSPPSMIGDITTKDKVFKNVLIQFPDASWKDYANGHGTYVEVQATAKKISVAQEIKSECATLCHGTDLLGGNSNKSCLTCHHSGDKATWLAKDKHGAAAIKEIAQCMGCHGAGLNEVPVTNGKTCATCHGPGMKATMTSHQDKTEVQTYYDQCCDPANCIDSNDWGDPAACTDCAGGFQNCGQPKQKTVITASFVPTIHKDLANQNLKSCQTCHGSDLKGGVSGKTCFVEGACHDPGNRYKDHAANKALWLQQIAAKQVDTVPALKITYPGGKMSFCTTACHNVLYQALNGGKQAFDGNAGCFDCHKIK